MTLKYYNQTVSKESIATYRRAFDHFNLTKTSQARAGSSFLVQKPKGNLISTHFSFNNHPETDPHPDEQPLPFPDSYAEHDAFIDNCIEEYFTWLAQTEVRRSQLTLSTIEPFKTTDWSSSSTSKTKDATI